MIGDFSAPVFSASTPEEHDRLSQASNDALTIRLWSVQLARVLESLSKSHEPIDREELAAFFETDVIDSGVAAQLADGVARFWTDDFNGAVHILAPNVEAAIRSLAAAIGLVVIKPPRGERPGGVRTLGAILSDLEGRIDEIEPQQPGSNLGSNLSETQQR